MMLTRMKLWGFASTIAYRVAIRWNMWTGHNAFRQGRLMDLADSIDDRWIAIHRMLPQDLHNEVCCA